MLCLNGAAGYDPEGRNYAMLLPNVGEDPMLVLAQVRLPRTQMMDMAISPTASPRGLWIETVLSDLGLSLVPLFVAC